MYNKLSTGGGRFRIKSGMTRKGFTLAEVLVTLAVIGVVASLTIPALVKNSQEAGWKSSFKKKYSELEQASRLIKQDRGNLGFTNHDDARANFKPYFPVSNDSYYAGSCWANGWKGLNGDLYPDEANSNCYILNNGSYLRISRTAMTVDVNGEKQPNTLGKDIFFLDIYPDRIEPRGGPGTPDNYNKKCDGSLSGLNGRGIGCAAKVLKNEDY